MIVYCLLVIFLAPYFELVWLEGLVNLAMPLQHLLCCWQVPQAALMQLEPREDAFLTPPASWFSLLNSLWKPVLISSEVQKRI